MVLGEHEKLLAPREEDYGELADDLSPVPRADGFALGRDGPNTRTGGMNGYQANNLWRNLSMKNLQPSDYLRLWAAQPETASVDALQSLDPSGDRLPSLLTGTSTASQQNTVWRRRNFTATTRPPL